MRPDEDSPALRAFLARQPSVRERRDPLAQALAAVIAIGAGIAVMILVGTALHLLKGAIGL